MKTFKIFICTILVTSLSYSVQAQFGRKLKEAVQRKAENAVINKTSEKAEQQVGKVLDDVLNPDFGGDKTIEKPQIINKENLPSSYSFQYKYDLKITSHGKETNVVKTTYYLSESGDYIATEMESTPMLVIFDRTNNAMISVMNDQIIPMKMPKFEDYIEDSAEDYTITKLPNKTIMGYDCIGRQLENSEYTLVVYMATGLDVDVSKMFQGNDTKIPASVQEMMDEFGNSMMMYLGMKEKDTSKKNAVNASMECVGFEKLDKTIKL